MESVVLKKLETINGFPKYKNIFKYNNQDALVETLLGPDLKRLSAFCGQKFDIITISKIAISIFKRLESLHSLGILHNDIKLANLAWGTIKNGKIGNAKDIFLLDFGLATRFKYFGDEVNNKCKKKNNNKIEARKIKSKNSLGNITFMSKEVLMGNSPCPKTELESFLYLIIYLFENKLPWTGIKSKNFQDKKNKIIECHKKITHKELCKNLPYQIAYIYNEINNLKIDEKPKYKYYRQILKELIYLKEPENNIEFCWEKKIYEAYKNPKKENIMNLLYDLQY